MNGRPSRRLATLIVAAATFAAVLVPPASSASAPAPSADPVAPRTAVLGGKRLQETKRRLDRGDPALRGALKDLVVRADGRLGQGPWTVVDKPKPAPSGDPHDYLSQAPYWWPSKPRTTENPWGCPYVQRDGERNPEVDTGTDHPDRAKVLDSAYTLSLAWYYTGKKQYAEHAAAILRTWYRGFLDWLVKSPFGKEEAAAVNNHGSFHDTQVAALAVTVGDDKLARKTVLDARKKRIDAQIAADGSQPGEISRTRSWHYSTFNLVALTRLADIGKHVGVNLWSYQGPGGGSLFKAVHQLIPAATSATPWPHPELDFHAYAASDIVHAAADAGDARARAAVPRLETPPGGDLWALRPAAEQLDSIKG